MFNYKFGIEIEFTGITRNMATTVVKDYFGGTVTLLGNRRDTRQVKAFDGRIWQITRDRLPARKLKKGLLLIQLKIIL